MEVTNCQDEKEESDNDTNLISEPDPVIGIEELPDDEDNDVISVTETPKPFLEGSTDSELPDPMLQEPTSTGRGRPRKSDTPKKLDDVQQSDSERKTDFMLVTPSLKRGRGRPPNPFKLPKPDGPKQRGRPRIHPPKIPSGRGRGRPRIHPPSPQTKSLEVRLVKCTVRDSLKKKGRPPGSKNKKKVKSLKDVIKRPRGRPPKSDSSVKVTSKETKSQCISKESYSKFTSKESMSYQDFVKQVNEELSAINGTSVEEDITENNDTTTEMEYSNDERDDSYSDDEWTDGNMFHELQEDQSPSPKCRAGRPPGAKNKPKDEKLLSQKKKNQGRGRPKKEKRGRGRPPKSLQISKEESPTVKKPGRPKSLGENDESKTRLCKGDVSYTEAVEDIIVEISDSENEYMSEEEEQPVKRGRGRPPKQATSYTDDVHDIEEQSDSEYEYMSEEEEDEQPVKKGRGRPRKIINGVGEVQSTKKSPGRPSKFTYRKEEVHSVGKGRGRGRPRKNANEEYPVHGVKKSPGRPRKNPYEKQDVSYTESVGDIFEEQSDSENEYISVEEHEQSVKKGRGRPKKISDLKQDSQPLKRGRGRPPKSDHDDQNIHPLKRGPGRPPKSTTSPGKRKRGRPSLSESKKLRLSIPGVTTPRKKENKKENEDLVIGRRSKTHINYAALAEGLDIEDKEEDLISSEDDTDNDNFVHKPNSEYDIGSGDMSYTHSEDSDLNENLSGKEEKFTKIINEKKGPGRPKKTDIIRPKIALNSNINLNFSEKRGRGRPKISERKGPGRPKKIASFISDDSQEESSASKEVSKRGRGRPKKVNNSIDLTSEDDFEQCKQSPSKSNIDQHGAIKRGPGRPKKVAPTLDMTCDEEDGTGISGITIEGWEGFAGGIHQSKECPIDILCNGSLPTEEQDDIAKCPPDSTEVPNIDSTDVNEINTSRQPVSYIDDVTIIDSNNLQLEPSPKPEENSIQNKLENIAKQINSKTTECTKLLSNVDSLTQNMIIQPLTINSTSQLVAITDSQPICNNNSAPQVVMINSTPHLLVNSTPQIATSSSVPHMEIQESSSSSVVTEAVVPQEKVISETIAQSSELGQVSSLYLDVSIS
ncbi:Hypothetical predicted protein [Mytilus galloprovincialis]|uniref:Uncharacterized protein n=1 Tax=Mytilus galloprovincialis TaxID=29158 RepID=A0A8B6GSV7_MYTGA|nr:Hypothetical predicted protein [Mytilus galloprovincialis]